MTYIPTTTTNDAFPHHLIESKATINPYRPFLKRPAPIATQPDYVSVSNLGHDYQPEINDFERQQQAPSAKRIKMNEEGGLNGPWNRVQVVHSAVSNQHVGGVTTQPGFHQQVSNVLNQHLQVQEQGLDTMEEDASGHAGQQQAQQVQQQLQMPLTGFMNAGWVSCKMSCPGYHVLVSHQLSLSKQPYISITPPEPVKLHAENG